MLNYKEFNINPKHRKTDDCTTRAIAMATGLSWEETLKIQYETALKTKYAIGSKQCDEKVLEQLGFYKHSQPRKSDSTKYSVNELDSIVSKPIRDKGVIVVIANHMTCVIGNDLVDTWNCGNKKIGNYFTK